MAVRARCLWRPTFMAALRDKQVVEIVYELTQVFGLADFPGFLIRVLDDGVLINHDEDANVASDIGRGHATGAPLPDLDAVAVAQAFLSDRFALATIRAIAMGEELLSDYSREIADPPYYTRLCERYGVDEDYFDN